MWATKEEARVAAVAVVDEEVKVTAVELEADGAKGRGRPVMVAAGKAMVVAARERVARWEPEDAGSYMRALLAEQAVKVRESGAEVEREG